MRRMIPFSLLGVALAFLLPPLLSAAPAPDGAPTASPAVTAAAPVRDASILLSVHTAEGDASMTMAEYLPLAVAGEMPAAFGEEALKAQAVALRTYALYGRAHRKNAHPDADVCADPGCCAALSDPEALRERWGAEFDTYNNKIRAAVAATDGQYLVYDGAPILAVFHASSYRATEDGGALGLSAPYLVSVATPETVETVRNLHSTVEVSAEEFRTTVLDVYPDAALPVADPGAWVGTLRPDAAGRVAAAEIGGVAVSGLALRQMFSLRSTDFTLAWDAAGGCFIFRVSGYGHGLGLSQYGAKLLAEAGEDYAAILERYYPGTALTV